MARIIQAPVCCGRYLGQLFSRIAVGLGTGYFFLFCPSCREGRYGKEVVVDLAEGESIRGMTRGQLERFRAMACHQAWKLSFADEVEASAFPSQYGYAPRRAWALVSRQENSHRRYSGLL